MERRDFLALMGLGALGAGLAACSSPPSSTHQKDTSSFPLGAAAAAKSKPAPVTMWHSMTSAELLALTSLTDRFNSSQSDVHVILVNQNSYASTLAEYAKASAKGTLPDLVQMDAMYLQTLVDGHRILPVQEAIEADQYDLSDFLPATIESFRISDSIWAMPFNCSVQVMYYDKAAFKRAALDPDSPPSDMTAMIDASTKIVRHGTETYGMSLKTAIAALDQWIALGGQTVVNNANGRNARATAVTLSSTGGSVVFDWLSEMFKSKLAQAVPDGSYNNLLAIGNQVAPMTIDSSSSLGTVTQILEHSDVELAIAPVPRLLPASSGGGPISQSGGLHIVHGSSPARIDGSWQFVKFLSEANSQATWAAATGFIPVRRSASQMRAVTSAWDASPGFRVAYEQLSSAPATPAASTPVVGVASEMISAFESAMTSLASGAKPSDELSKAVNATDYALASYNSRV
jgi:sn-glycerol 3-phosphate transport system substrate-binding protein